MVLCVIYCVLCDVYEGFTLLYVWFDVENVCLLFGLPCFMYGIQGFFLVSCMVSKGFYLVLCAIYMGFSLL